MKFSQNKEIGTIRAASMKQREAACDWERYAEHSDIGIATWLLIKIILIVFEEEREKINSANKQKL